MNGKERAMAKKQSGEEKAGIPGTAPAPEAQGEGKPRGGKGDDKGRGKPEAPAAAQPGPAAEAGAGGEATVAAAPIEVKRRGQQPGKPPRRGKKLREQLANQRKRLAKE